MQLARRNDVKHLAGNRLARQRRLVLGIISAQL
jgi:hypothetical protein